MLRSPVVDQTGPDGLYDIDSNVRQVPPATGGGPDAAPGHTPSFFTVLREFLDEYATA